MAGGLRRGTFRRYSGLSPSQDLASNSAQEAPQGQAGRARLCKSRVVGADPGAHVRGKLPRLSPLSPCKLKWQHLPGSSMEKSRYVTGLQKPFHSQLICRGPHAPLVPELFCWVCRPGASEVTQPLVNVAKQIKAPPQGLLLASLGCGRHSRHYQEPCKTSGHWGLARSGDGMELRGATRKPRAGTKKPPVEVP